MPTGKKANRGGRARLAGVTLSFACSILLLWTAAAAAAVPPAVEITSPTQSSTVEGTVAVMATAKASSGLDIESVVFYDGVNQIGEADCNNQPTCDASISWQATGLSGPHALTAKANQNDAESTTSAPVTVTVLSPPPTVSITSPAAGSTVKGTIAVSVSGATDPSQDDYPTNMYVYDGVNEIGSIECQGQQICQGTVSWRATGLSGVHTLTAKLVTHDDLSVISPPAAVTVLSPAPSVTITSPSPGARLGGTIIVKVSGATDPSQSDYPTTIDVFDGAQEIGSIKCQGQQTCGGDVSWNTMGLRGAQSLAAVIHTETGRSASSPHVVVGGAKPRPPTPRARAKSHARGTCHLQSVSVPVKRLDHGMCVIPGVPAGTRVAIQYRNKAGGWSTAVRDRVRHGGRFRFSLRGLKRAVFKLTILIEGNRVYATTRLPIGTLRIG